MNKEIKKHIEEYFKRNGMKYEVLDVFKYPHPADHYLYAVVARDIDYDPIKKAYGCGEFTTWNCWNESTKCLNYGHYDISTYERAVQIAMKYLFNE